MTKHYFLYQLKIIAKIGINMPVTHTNKGGKTYYLHQGTTKTGKPRYYFSMTQKNDLLVEKIPDGYEIYEHPANAQVFLRKKQIQMMTDIEQHLINKHLKKLKRPHRYISDIKGKIITIFQSSRNIDSLKEFFYMKRQPPRQPQQSRPPDGQ